MNKACFLDRDGVINEEVCYLSDPEGVILIPGIADGIRLVREAGYLVVVITNQAGVARGFYKEDRIPLVHAEIQRQLAANNTQIDAFYYCPHHPEYSGECECRKPKPGMLFTAARDLDIDLPNSFIIGDRLSDLDAGVNAGLCAQFLVETGYGAGLVAKGSAIGRRVAKTPYDAIVAFLSENSN